MDLGKEKRLSITDPLNPYGNLQGVLSAYIGHHSYHSAPFLRANYYGSILVVAVVVPYHDPIIPEAITSEHGACSWWPGQVITGRECARHVQQILKVTISAGQSGDKRRANGVDASCHNKAGVWLPTCLGRWSGRAQVAEEGMTWQHCRRFCLVCQSFCFRDKRKRRIPPVSEAHHQVIEEHSKRA